jgi:hypothetical protein
LAGVLSFFRVTERQRLIVVTTAPVAALLFFLILSPSGVHASRRQQSADRSGAPPIGGPAGAAAVCATWEGTSSALTVCQPKLLRSTMLKGEFGTRIRPNVRIARFRGRIYAARGVTQAIGQPLVVGQAASIRGPLERGSEVAVRVYSQRRRWLAWFKLPRLGKSRVGSVAIRSGSRPRVVLRFGKDTVFPRYLGIDHG